MFFQKKLHNWGMSDHVAPSGRAPGLARGKLPSCMKAALLAGCMGGKWGGPIQKIIIIIIIKYNNI